MSRFFYILIGVVGMMGCQGIPLNYEMPNNWNQLSLTERQAWLEGYYWGSKNYSWWWNSYPFGYSSYYHSGWGGPGLSFSRQHVSDDEIEPQKDKPSESPIRSEPPHTLSSQSTHCSAGNPCKQFRPR